MTRAPQKGDVLPELRRGPVQRIDLVRYAGASGDFNPIHTVESFAREQGLGDVIAHGMLTMAYVGQLLTDFAGPGAFGRDFSVRFRAMVRPGDEIVCRGAVTEVTADAAGATAACSVSAVNQNGETVVRGTAALRYPAP